MAFDFMMSFDEAKSNARHLLPQMPEEVFQLWFDGRIENNGWPPFGSIWDAALRHYPLSIWQRLQWKKELLRLDINLMHPKTLEIIKGLQQAYFLNKPNSYSDYLGDSRPRFNSIMNYVKQHRQLPSILVFVEDETFLDAVDGCHRLALFFALRAIPQFQNLVNDTQLAWIGYEPGIACQRKESN